MDAIIAPNTVPLAQADGPPGTGTPGWATNGNPVAQIPATKFPGYHYNGVIQELLAVIQAGGIVPDRTNLAQVLAAIQAITSATSLWTSISAIGASPLPVAPGWCNAIEADLIGGGGGGSNSQGGNSSGGGGGAGAELHGVWAIAPGQVPQAVVGGGGGAQVAGGATTLSINGVTVATAGGGGGAQFVGGLNVCAGAQGGVASQILATRIMLQVAGGWGSDGQQTTPFYGNGNGASGPFGGGGRAGSGGGEPGTAHGAGGGGAYDPAAGAATFQGGAGFGGPAALSLPAVAVRPGTGAAETV